MVSASPTRLSHIVGKFCVLLLCFFIIFQLLTSSPPWTFLDFANLGFHEAGHLVMTFFGQFVSILSGSLMQILIPLSILLYFYKTYQFFSCGFALFWLGESINNVSIYIGDATDMHLPLIQDGLIHDWNWLLTTMNVLQYDYIFSSITSGIGILTMIGGMIWMGWSIFSDISKRLLHTDV